jgi:hypothetical protein
MLTSLPPSPTASVKGLPLQDAPQDVVIVVKHGHGQTIHLVITFALLIWHNLTFQLITTHQNFSQLPVILIFRLVSMHQQTALRHLDGSSRSQFLPGTSFRMSSTIPAFCAGDKRQAITSQSHDNQTSDTYRSYRTMMREVCKSTQDMTCKHTHTNQTHPWWTAVGFASTNYCGHWGVGWILGSSARKRMQTTIHHYICLGPDQYPITMLNLGDEHL